MDQQGGCRALVPHLEESGSPLEVRMPLWKASASSQVPPLSAYTTICGTKVPPFPPLKTKLKDRFLVKSTHPELTQHQDKEKLQEQAAGAIPLPGCPSECQTLQSPNSGQEISMLFCRFEFVYEDNSEGCTPILSHQQSCLCEFRGLNNSPQPFLISSNA